MCIFDLMELKALIALRNKYVKTTKRTLDYNKFNHYSIVHHSTAIEGSTLTERETHLLLNEQLTPKDKPLQHSLMAVDHLNALNKTIALAEAKEPITENLLQDISGIVLKNSHGRMNTPAGSFDPSQGEYRNVSVVAGKSVFPKAAKVPELMGKLVDQINDNLTKVKGFEQVNRLAFQAHFQLVTIHPFIDGNGRVSRLLMNYIQAYHNEPLTIVNSTHKSDYISALIDTRAKKDIKIFEKFMFNQAGAFFKSELQLLGKTMYKSNDKGKGLSYIF